MFNRKSAIPSQYPQALKMFYEKNANLAPKIPVGTSPELCELLMGLLKRNARERMNFEMFFNHKFLQRPEPLLSHSPLQGDLPFPMYGSPPTSSKVPLRSSTPLKISSPPISQPESPRSTRNALSSSPEDDYVIVPQNIPMHSDQSTESSVEKEKPSLKLPVRSSPLPCIPIASPTRPSFLPISSEPIPVPTQRDAFQRMYSQSDKKEEPPSPTKTSSSVPRSAPITMKKRPERQNDIDISSLSPPSVQFVIGTPPGGRRRSTSGSLCETPPPPNLWTVSPVSAAKSMPINSPLRRSDHILSTSPPILSGPLARVPILSSPNLSDNNNLGKSPVIPFCTRAITLPEISEMGNYHTFFGDASANDTHPITFVAPELPEETLLEVKSDFIRLLCLFNFFVWCPTLGAKRGAQHGAARCAPRWVPKVSDSLNSQLWIPLSFQREHNETLAKINFVLALSNCILELAAQRAAPLAALVDPSQQNQPVNEMNRRAEQLVLLVRALQLLSSGLALATRQLKSGQLRPSTTVKNVVSTLNTKFRATLQECKQLNSTGLMNKVGSTSITADKILYNHAIQMCQSAALDELFGNPEECFQRYQTAQILLHSLSQQVHNQQDRLLLTKYKDAVEKRLYVLQQQGYIYATDVS
ncbi:hypothetical protein NQ318_004194 [Aromia moschata]|uniref:ATG1-like MIT domain-containing protein n=1 Tax=Aromia moschata TaxID=1265417 RepID=A0AAV8Y6J4_9CUCU|nr:hypothetical protein NQ318_004194 [Aromia moschata]